MNIKLNSFRRIFVESYVVTALIVLFGCNQVGNPNDDRAFLTNLNNNIQTTNWVLLQQVDQEYCAFERLYLYEPEKADSYWEKASDLRYEATDLINYIEALKWDLVKKVEEKDATTAFAYDLLKSIDTLREGHLFFYINTSMVRPDTQKASSIMLQEGKAIELASILKHFREDVINMIGLEYADEVGLKTDGNWANNVFGNKTLIEDVIVLNNLIMETYTIELNVITQLMSEIRANGYAFDEIGVKVFAESNYLLSGQTYRAQVILSAWKNSFLTARVKLDGGAEKEYTSNAQGIIPLEWNVGVGSHKYTGVIDMLDPATNQMVEFPFESSFTVVSPSSN